MAGPGHGVLKHKENAGKQNRVLRAVVLLCGPVFFIAALKA